MSGGLNVLAGAYVPRPSLLHRAPAGAKLLALAAACAALPFLRSAGAILLAAVVVGLLYVVARVGFAAAWAQVRPLRWFLVLLLAVQLLLTDPVTAVSLTGRVALAVALAGLVTLTTRTSDLVAAVERGLSPLRRIGVDPGRLSLLLALTVRSIPVLAAVVARIHDAQRARGHEHSLRAFAVPLLVGALRQADALGEALRARGLDDDE